MKKWNNYKSYVKTLRKASKQHTKQQDTEISITITWPNRYIHNECLAYNYVKGNPEHLQWILPFFYDNFLPFPNESRWYMIYQWLERTHTAAKYWNKWFDFDLTKKLLHDKKQLKNIAITVWKMFESYLA